MQAARILTETTIEPFGDPVGETPILDRTLAESQAAALHAAGHHLPTTLDPHAPTLVFSDRTWFTRAMVQKLGGWTEPGRLTLADPVYARFVEPLQPGPPEIGVLPAGSSPTLPALLALPARPEPLDLQDLPPPNAHPAFAHATRPLRVGPAMVSGVSHWSHVVHTNLLALAAQGLEAKADFEAFPAWKKLWIGLSVLWKAGSTEPTRLARAVSEIGPRSKVHPTAVVEACRIGADVEIGAFAVVRGAVIGDGARIEEHSYVGLSVVGARAQVARHTMVNLSVLMPGALVSAGNGFQLSVFGRDSFVARGVTALDLSFGKPIMVEHQGQRVSSESWFLGVAVGHAARIGAGVRLGYGLAVPNGTLLVAPPHDLIRAIQPLNPADTDTTTVAQYAVDGVAVPVNNRRPGEQPEGPMNNRRGT